MSRLRLLLFWLLAVAVPLQGFAATTLLLCGGAAVHGPAAKHGHADAAAPHHHGGPDAQGALQSQDPQHDCGLCADCCHGAAMSAAAAGVASIAARRDAGMESTSVIPSRATRLPDKPPRS